MPSSNFPCAACVSDWHPFEASREHRKGGGAEEALLRKTSIRRVHYAELSQTDFEAQHEETRRPVIIEGFASLALEGSPK